MEQEHIVKSYDLELQNLKKLLKKVINLCTKQIDRLYVSISENDLDKAKKIVKDDSKIDSIDRDIVNLSINIFSLRSPVARDLRFVFAASHISKNAERIGDNISNVANKLLENPDIYKDDEINMKLLEAMHIEVDMLRILVKLMDKYTTKKVKKIQKRNILVEEIYISSAKQLLKHLKESDVQCIYDYFLIFRYVERVSGHIMNISEYINYTETASFQLADE